MLKSSYIGSMEKTCTKCGISKPLNEYHIHKKGKHGRQPRCKNCIKEYNISIKSRLQEYYQENKEHIKTQNKKFTDSKKDGNYHVYTISNYAGVTTRPDTRLQAHKYFGRDANTWRVLYSTPYEEEALELEALLHDEGYEGRHVNALNY